MNTAAPSEAASLEANGEAGEKRRRAASWRTLRMLAAKHSLGNAASIVNNRRAPKNARTVPRG